MNYSNLQPMLLLILFTLCFNTALSVEITQDSREEEDSEEFENALLKNVRADYRHGFVQLLNLVTSMNNTLTTQIMKLGTQIAKLNAQAEDLKYHISLITSVNKLKSNLSWEDFDELTVSKKTEMRIGKSFNGSTLLDIKNRTLQAANRYAVVVFENHLDETIENFTIYDKYNSTHNPAPKSIPPHTREIFTFAKLSNTDKFVVACFSYAIPSADIRLAAFASGGAYGIGLAFLPIDASMKNYYGARKIVERSSAYDCCEAKDKKLMMGYKNLYARMFAQHEGSYKTTLRIELIKLPL